MALHPAAAAAGTAIMLHVECFFLRWIKGAGKYGIFDQNQQLHQGISR
jgi:hypothetical protein